VPEHRPARRPARPAAPATGPARRQAPRRRQRLARTLTLVFAVALVAALALVLPRLHHEPKAGGVAVTASRPHFTAGVVSCTFTDGARRTANYLTGVSTAGRVIPTEIRYPTTSGSPGLAETAGAHPAIRHGPYPLIVFAEGYAVTPATYAKLLDRWVRAGFVVAAPRFPDTDAAAVAAQHNVDTEGDDVNQPADTGFVTRTIEAEASEPASACGVLHRLLIPNEVALAGQSDGAETVAGLAYDAHYAEAGLHFTAVVALSGQAFGAESSSGPDPYLAGPPLLVTQSATDTCNPPQLSTQLYSLVHQSAKWFLELRSAYHLPPYSGSDPTAFSAVASVTTRFFSLEFAHGTPGQGFLAYGDRSPPVATLSTGASPPTIKPLTGSAASCYLHY